MCSLAPLVHTWNWLVKSSWCGSLTWLLVKTSVPVTMTICFGPPSEVPGLTIFMSFLEYKVCWSVAPSKESIYMDQRSNRTRECEVISLSKGLIIWSVERYLKHHDLPQRQGIKLSVSVGNSFTIEQERPKRPVFKSKSDNLGSGGFEFSSYRHLSHTVNPIKTPPRVEKIRPARLTAPFVPAGT